MAKDMMKSFLRNNDYTAGQPKKSSEDAKNRWGKEYGMAVAGAMQNIKEKELAEREVQLMIQQQEVLNQMIQINQMAQALQSIQGSLSPVPNGGGLPPDMGGGLPPDMTQGGGMGGMMGGQF